jgi:hypothetical protein
MASREFRQCALVRAVVTVDAIDFAEPIKVVEPTKL